MAAPRDDVSVAPSTISLRSILIVVSARNPGTWYRKRSERAVTGGHNRAAAAVADTAPDLEEIGEVRPAEEPQLTADRLGRGVEDRNLLEGAAAHEPQATHGDAVGTKAGCLGVRQEEGRGVVVDGA